MDFRKALAGRHASGQHRGGGQPSQRRSHRLVSWAGSVSPCVAASTHENISVSRPAASPARFFPFVATGSYGNSRGTRRVFGTLTVCSSDTAKYGGGCLRTEINRRLLAPILFEVGNKSA